MNTDASNYLFPICVGTSWCGRTNWCSWNNWTTCVLPIVLQIVICLVLFRVLTEKMALMELEAHLEQL